MPDENSWPAFYSRWTLGGPTWFHVPTPGQPDSVTYAVATRYVNNGRMIDAEADGLNEEDFAALRARYPDVVGSEGEGVFTLPYVPEGTVVDITPVAGMTVAANPAGGWVDPAGFPDPAPNDPSRGQPSPGRKS